MGKGSVARRSEADYSGKQESADYSSKQNSGSGWVVSLQPSLLEQADRDMRKPLSLLAIYGTAEEADKKANTWWIFKLRKLVSCRLFVKGWRHIMSCHFIRRRMKTHKELPFVRWKKLSTEFGIWKKPKFQSPAAQRRLREKEKLILWMNRSSEVWCASLNEYPKKRLVHEERDNN